MPPLESSRPPNADETGSLPSLGETAPGFSTNGSVPIEGTIIGGKYRVVRLIGLGGMGIVVEARSLDDERQVAIKCLAREALDDTELLDRFSREARAFARIQSKHVARIFDTGVHDGRPFIVLEYLDGIDIAGHLAKQGRLELAEATRYVIEACEALAEAHAAGIIHRDIKPSNLFLAKQSDGTTIVKVLDFGISKLIDDPVTDTRSFLGTVIYMSPEQLRSSKTVDHRTDIWALGVVLFELLTGAVPFEGADVQEVIQSVGVTEPRSIGLLRPDLPAKVADTIARCLRRNAGERYDSVRALAAALAPFANLVKARAPASKAAAVEPARAANDGAFDFPGRPRRTAPSNQKPNEKRNENRNQNGTEKRSVVDEGTCLKGTFASTCPILVRGVLQGDVNAPAVTVNATGELSGTITTGALESEGRIAGDYDVETAKLEGTVADKTVIRASAVELSLTVATGKLQLTFGPTGTGGRGS